MNFLNARYNMVEQQVRPWFVFDKNVLEVMGQIPRELFVPDRYKSLAYSDTAIPLGDKQTMLTPRVVGRSLDSLNLTGVEKVLEIGTGTGYVTACLSKLAKTVVSLEINPVLHETAQKNLQQLHCRNVTLLLEDGVMGWKTLAPYDVIYLTGSYPLGIPQAVCDQLDPQTGRLFGTCGTAPNMEALLIKRSDKQWDTHVLFETIIPSLINAPQPSNFKF